MISYLTQQQAGNTLTNFGGISGLTPLLGAFIADSFAGRFWTITVASIIYQFACWGLGYVVATLFFAVVEMSIDTIILSYCQDAEEHQGTAHYAPPLLIETFDEQNEVQRIAQ
ncbi:putative choline transporter [Helianthus anomalus]